MSGIHDQVDAVDPHERLSADDMATRVEEQLRTEALRARRAVPASRPGVCANCGSSCMPLAIYCDEPCRDDHEHRGRVLEQAGRRR